MKTNKIIAVLLLLFASMQIYMLYQQHLSLQEYTAEEKQQVPFWQYQFQTYGSIVVYLVIIYLSGTTLLGYSQEWIPTKPFRNTISAPKVSGGGRIKNGFEILKMRRKTK